MDTIIGLDQFIRDLQRIQAWCEQPSASFVNDVTSYMVTSVRTNFDSGGRPKWVKRKRTYPHPPLMKTKALYNSIGTIQRVQNGTIEVGTVCEYAGYQNDGTETIDARPFMVWQNRDVEYIREAIIRNIIAFVS